MAGLRCAFRLIAANFPFFLRLKLDLLTLGKSDDVAQG
jgi:hypothetical protein